MVRKQLSKEEALSRLKHICASNEKCLYDVKQKLKSWGLIDIFDEIADELIDEKYIDELRYAESFANDKVKFSYWGRKKIRYTLIGKGISDSTIDSALKSLNLEEYRQVVEKELNKKMRSLKEEDAYKKKQKVFAFAAQRGYEGDLVSDILGDLDTF